VRRVLLLAASIVFVDTTFYAAITPLLPEFVDEFGLSKGGAGVLVAAYAAGTFAGSLPSGWLAARAGVRATVLTGLALLGVTSVAFAFAPSVLVLDLARFLQGVGAAATWAGAFGWLIGATPRERRGEMIGSAMAAAIAGALVGPALGAAAAAWSPEAVFSCVPIAAAGLAVWALRTPPVIPEGNARLRDLLSLARERPVLGGMWLTTLPGLLFGTIGVLAPLRLDELGAGSTAIAAVFLIAAGLEALVSPVVGRISDRRGRLVPVIAGLVGATVLLALLPWPDTAWLLGLLVIATSPAVGTLWAPAMSLLSDGAELVGLEQGFAFALVNIAWSVGDTVGAAGGGRLGQAAGDEVPYLILSALCALTLLGAAARMRAAEPARAAR
jgi:predicted MFS family arabinose efflux permease